MWYSISLAVAVPAKFMYWTSLLQNVNLKTIPGTQECSYRHETLFDAKVVCATTELCGGITRDNGVECGDLQLNMKFQLRSKQIMFGQFYDVQSWTTHSE